MNPSDSNSTYTWVVFSGCISSSPAPPCRLLFPADALAAALAAALSPRLTTA